MSHGDRHVLLTFPYDVELISQVKSHVPGGKFDAAPSGEKGWRYVKTMDICRIIREVFPTARFDEDVLAWGREERLKMQLLQEAASGEITSGDLVRFKEVMPELFEMMWPYQRNAVSYGAMTEGYLLADEPGLGKTIEVIGALEESGATDGPILIICPKLSIEDVWLYELNRHNPEYNVFLAPEGRREREKLIEEVNDALDMEEPFFLVVNPHMVSFRRGAAGEGVYDPITDSWLKTPYPFLLETHWQAVVVDEAHMTGLCNPHSQTARAFGKLTTKKKIAMTGTPSGGKPMRLWGILNWLDPKTFNSAVRWGNLWLAKTEVRYRTPDGQDRIKWDFTSIKKNREEAFYTEHAPWILRRTKEDVNPERPKVIEIHRWANMGPKQQQQYREMDHDASVLAQLFEEKQGRISQPNVLATYTFLRQFAGAYCNVEQVGERWVEEIEEFVPKLRATPTRDSCKLPVIEEILTQLGIFDPGEDSQVVIFSQFKRMVDMIHLWLTEVHNVNAMLITGATNTRANRLRIKSDFQAEGGVRVACVSTKAGGVSINLDRADDCIMVDETWDPDDQRQAIDRLDRMSRLHQVTAYYVRTKQTIEQEVWDATMAKKDVNAVMFDRFRTRRS